MRYPPFVYSQPHPKGSKGIFIDFLEVFSHITQRPLHFRANDTDYLEEVATAYDYGSVIEDLHWADFFVGPSNLLAMELFDLSPILNEDDVVFVSPRFKVDYWKKIGTTIRKNVTYFWIFVGTFCVLGLMVFLLAGRRIQLSDSLMLLYSALLNVGYNLKLPKFITLRLYVGKLLLLFVVLTIMVQGSFISGLTSTVYDPPITNVRSLIDSGLPVLTNELLTSFLGFQKKKYPEFAKLREHVQLIEEKDLLTILDDLYVQRNYSTITLIGKCTNK